MKPLQEQKQTHDRSNRDHRASHEQAIVGTIERTLTGRWRQLRKLLRCLEDDVRLDKAIPGAHEGDEQKGAEHWTHVR